MPAESIQRVNACDNKTVFEELQREAETVYHLQNDITIMDILTQKSLDLGLVDEGIFEDAEGDGKSGAEA